MQDSGLCYLSTSLQFFPPTSKILSRLTEHLRKNWTEALFKSLRRLQPRVQCERWLHRCINMPSYNPNRKVTMPLDSCGVVMESCFTSIVGQSGSPYWCFASLNSAPDELRPHRDLQAACIAAVLLICSCIQYLLRSMLTCSFLSPGFTFLARILLHKPRTCPC